MARPDTGVNSMTWLGTHDTRRRCFGNAKPTSCLAQHVGFTFHVWLGIGVSGSISRRLPESLAIQARNLKYGHYEYDSNRQEQFQYVSREEMN